MKTLIFKAKLPNKNLTTPLSHINKPSSLWAGLSNA